MPWIILGLAEAKNTMNIADTSICLECETVYLFSVIEFIWTPAEFLKEQKAHKMKQNKPYKVLKIIPSNYLWTFLLIAEFHLQSAGDSAVSGWITDPGKVGKTGGEQQIMEMRLHLSSVHISEAWSVSHRSPECLPSSPSNPQLWDQTFHYALEDSRQERSTLLKNAGMAKWIRMTSNTLCWDLF